MLPATLENTRLPLAPSRRWQLTRGSGVGSIGFGALFGMIPCPIGVTISRKTSRSSVDKTHLRRLPPNKLPCAFWRHRHQSICRTLQQDLQQFIGIRFEGLTNLDEFQDVDTPFAAFIFGDKRLRPAKSLGEFVLGQTCAFSRF